MRTAGGRASARFCVFALLTSSLRGAKQGTYGARLTAPACFAAGASPRCAAPQQPSSRKEIKEAPPRVAPARGVSGLSGAFFYRGEGTERVVNCGLSTGPLRGPVGKESSCPRVKCRSGAPAPGRRNGGWPSEGTAPLWLSPYGRKPAVGPNGTPSKRAQRVEGV